MSATEWYDHLTAGFVRQAAREVSGPGMAEAPLVSVCVTAYQHGRYIRECLDGILSQETPFPYEVIIGEDGSTDDTRDICVEYAKRHPARVRLFLRDRSESVFKDGDSPRYLNGRWTRMSARGKYVAMCEGDDCWLDPQKLSTQVAVMEAHPTVTLCGHAVRVGATRDGESHVYPARSHPLLNALPDVLTDNWIPTCSMLLKASIAKDPLAWAWRLPFGDWPMQVTAAMQGPVAYLNEPMAFYREHAAGAWSQFAMVEKRVRICHFYEALHGVVPDQIWESSVRPTLVALRLRVARDYRTAGRQGDSLRAYVHAVRDEPRLTLSTMLEHRTKSLASMIRGRKQRGVL